MNDRHQPPPSAHPAGLQQDEQDLWDESDGISGWDMLQWIGESKAAIAGLVTLGTLVAVVVALLLPNVYTARMSMLPPGGQPASGAASALAQLGALGGLAGGLGVKTPDDLYVSLLRSDSVQRSLDEEFKLRERLDVDTYEELRAELPKIIRLGVDRKSGVISVEVDDENPEFASKLANAHALELTRMLSRMAVTEAQQRRAFFEQQLAQTKENLVRAEDDMRALQERSGVIVLDKQAEALIQSAAYVRSQIAEREVQLRVLRNTATDQNPDVRRLQTEVSALRGELTRMESAERPGRATPVDVPVGRLPSAAIDFIRARREVKLQETLLESMLRQFEIAKLDEAREGPLPQVVDPAVPPDRKSKPRRAMIVGSTALGLLLLGVSGAILYGHFRSSSPANGTPWGSRREVWRAWGLRR
jgi:tyrosine-protein kinase Etk/Wzc